MKLLTVYNYLYMVIGVSAPTPPGFMPSAAGMRKPHTDVLQMRAIAQAVRIQQALD